jgi:hypothetical protein
MHFRKSLAQDQHKTNSNKQSQDSAKEQTANRGGNRKRTKVCCKSVGEEKEPEQARPENEGAPATRMGRHLSVGDSNSQRNPEPIPSSSPLRE